MERVVEWAQLLAPIKMEPITELSIGGLNISQLAERFGTPIYVYDEARIRQNYRLVRDTFAKYYPNSRIFYAVKCNSNPAICHILRQEGAGMDTASVNEIKLAKSLGLKGEEIIFSGNFLSDEDLQQGLETGVIFNLDDISLLPRLLKFGLPEVISFRVNPGLGKSNIGHFVITGGVDAKFGLHEDQVLEAYRAAKEAGIKRFGVHMMAGSCVTDPEYFAEITGRLLDIAGKVSRELAIEFEFIDLGGGLGIPYRPGEKTLDMEKTVELITATYRQKVEEYGMKEPRLMMEPGRYFVADAGYLIGRVQAVKRGYQDIWGSDVGMNIVPRVILYGAYHHLRVNKKDHLPKQKTQFTGQICEQTDLWGKDLMLPPLEIGDLFWLENMGAYSYAMSYSYNGRFKPREILVNNGQAEIIREAEHLEDYLKLCVLPERLKS